MEHQHWLAANLGAGVAPVLAGMVAEGTASIEGVSRVDRGDKKSDHRLHLLKTSGTDSGEGT